MYVSIVSYREHKFSELFGCGGMETFLTTAGKLPRSKEFFFFKEEKKFSFPAEQKKRGGGEGGSPLKGKLQTIFSSPEPKARVSYCRPFSSVVRRPSSVNFLHFHLLLENAWLDFNQTWQESSLGVGDSKLFKQYVWPPWGPRGRAPKGQNHANFKHLLLQIQKENSQVMQCVDTLLDEEQKLFRQFPGWPLWALCKK